jgi:hypothetical protein
MQSPRQREKRTAMRRRYTDSPVVYIAALAPAGTPAHLPNDCTRDVDAARVQCVAAAY